MQPTNDPGRAKMNIVKPTVYIPFIRLSGQQMPGNIDYRKPVPGLLNKIFVLSDFSE